MTERLVLDPRECPRCFGRWAATSGAPAGCPFCGHLERPCSPARVSPAPRVCAICGEFPPPTSGRCRFCSPQPQPPAPSGGMRRDERIALAMSVTYVGAFLAYLVALRAIGMGALS